MSVTIKDVAIAAGVSVATVSRVVNRVNSVDAQIRSRVEEKIVELGYKPNQIARSLKNDVTNTVGVVVSNIANPFFVNVTLQIEKIVRKNNYTMLIVSTDSDQKKEIESIQLLESKRLDGIIISPNTNEISQLKIITA